MQVKERRVFRTGNVIGVKVKTPDHKKLGEIEELVVDIESGKTIFAVLSFGGHFGFGDKFFAVPWDEFKLIRDEAEQYFELETDQDRLTELPGFDKSDWPDVASTDWDASVDWGDYDESYNPPEHQSDSVE